MSDSERAHAHALICSQLVGFLGEAQASERASAIIAALDTAANERPGALLRRGDIVQLNPDFVAWPGCLLTIDSVGADGVVGTVRTEFGRETLLGVEFKDIEHTGGVALTLPLVSRDQPFVMAA